MPEYTLPEIVADLSEVDAKAQDFYERTEDGSYRLASIKELKNAKQREKEERKRWKQIASDYETKYGNIGEEDLEELIKLREEKRSQEMKSLEERRQWEALRGQLEQNFKKQLDDKEKEAKRNWHLLEEYVRQDHIRQALEERGVTETGKRILPKLLQDRVKLALTEDGNPGLRFFDDHGNQVMVNAKSEDYTIADLMEEVYSSYDDLFVGANKSGTGAVVSAKHAARQNVVPSKMSDRQKAEFIAQHGEETYYNLLRIERDKAKAERQF